MPTLADIYSAADSFKRRLADVVQNPGLSLQQMVGYANDRARALNELNAQAAQETMDSGQLFGSKMRELGETLASAYNPTGMTVWHGSPYKFTAFDPRKIGTGEGAQAYGHGLYVAENPVVAKGYAKNVKDMSSIQELNAKLSRLYKTMNEDSVYPGAYRKFKSEKGRQAAEEYDHILEIRNQKSTDPGNLYKIDLPDEHINKMLDWDKPLSQQPKNVQKALKGIEEELPSIPDFDLKKYMDADPLASTWHNVINRDLQVKQPEISALLAKKGIPGIKYLDEQSRVTGLDPYYQLIRKSDNSVYRQMTDLDKAKQFVRDAKKQGVDFEISEPIDKRTRNFVIFPGNEHLLKITDINNNPIR
jgi:hypothetical protein